MWRICTLLPLRDEVMNCSHPEVIRDGPAIASAVGAWLDPEDAGGAALASQCDGDGCPTLSVTSPRG